MVSYVVHRAEKAPPLTGEWDHPAWARADIARIDHFHPDSSSHRPRTRAKVLYDDKSLHVMFDVEDRYVRSVRVDPQSSVSADSCVEFFVGRAKRGGYFNFEVNCGGTMLLYYIEDARRKPDGFTKFTKLPPAEVKAIEVYHSMPKVVEPEIAGPTPWRVQYRAPWELMERYAGKLWPISGEQWHGNFFKCADETSHPHWGSWNPIGEELNFHQPARFAPVIFAP